MKVSVLAALAASAIPAARADVSVPSLFSDHMVLQRDKTVAIWGWAEPNERITVSIADTKGKVHAKGKVNAWADGQWRIDLGKMDEGGPHTMTIKGKNTIVIDDVMIGEVWLGSGQSNMALTTSNASNFGVEQFHSEYPQIRMFKVESDGMGEPQKDCKGRWLVCSSNTVGEFSAALYFYGRELHQELKVPVGLINSSVGGTPIESWISTEAQSSSAPLQPYLDSLARKEKAAKSNALAAAKSSLPAATTNAVAAATTNALAAATTNAPTSDPNPRVGGLFNGKIAPLIPYTVRGAVWYQGEANASNDVAQYYEVQLPLLIEDWRKRWGYEFPFAWVQLPNFAGRSNAWCVVRDGMFKSLKLPNTGMAVTLDIGDALDIHPKNKQEVAHRLALWALGDVYGRPVSAVSGPLYNNYSTHESEITLTFKHTNGGLIARGGELRGFEVSGGGRQWKPAVARIEGNRVVVHSGQVAAPSAVRYGWRDNPDCNLYNGAGLPASPFRTANW